MGVRAIESSEGRSVQTRAEGEPRARFGAFRDGQDLRR